MSSPKLRVAICGGGIGGLVCAAALSRYHDVAVDVYEAADALAAPGAPGVGVWPRAWKILSALGLADALGKAAVVPPDELQKIAFTFRKGDQPEGVSFHTLHTPGLLAIQRPDFAAVCIQHLSPRVRAHPGARLATYHQPRPSSSFTPSGPVVLEFTDGTQATCDVLVGADGAGSSVRRTLAGELADALVTEGNSEEEAASVRDAAGARFSGTFAYRGTVPTDAVPGHPALEGPMFYLGKDIQLTVYPTSHGLSFVLYHSNAELEGAPYNGPLTEDVPGAELIPLFREWEPQVRALIEATRNTLVNKWAIHVADPLPSLVSGNVVLLGDAASTTLPHLGSGPGQAIEDAYVLATLLGDRRTSTAARARALQAYDAVRRPAAARVQDCARETGALCALTYPGLEIARPVVAPRAANGSGSGASRARERDRDRDRDRDEDGGGSGGEADSQAEDWGKLAEIRSRVRTNWEWEWRTTVDVDVVKALRMLDD